MSEFGAKTKFINQFLCLYSHPFHFFPKANFQFFFTIAFIHVQIDLYLIHSSTHHSITNRVKVHLFFTTDLTGRISYQNSQKVLGKVEEVEMAAPIGTMAGGAEPVSTPPRPCSQDPNSNRAKTTTPRSTTPRSRKRVPSVLQNLKSAEEKQAYIETLEKELDALFRYYKEAVAEKVRIELSQCGGSRNAVVAALLEESDLPLSKLVDEIHDRLNGEVGSGAIVLAEPVTYATVKSSVLFAGQRVTYGLPNADADVLEDYAESCLWCWEVIENSCLS